MAASPPSWLSTAVDDAKSATSDFTSSLGDLGKPDTEAGQQAKDSVDKLSGSDRRGHRHDPGRGRRCATGVSGIVNAVQVISATVSKAGSQVTDTLTSFQDLDAKGELESAFKDASSCQTLTGGS